MQEPMNRTTTPENARLGTAIRQRRAECGLSQEALAAESSTDPGHMSLIEQGKVGVPAARLNRIASALGVASWELYRRAAEVQLPRKRTPRRRSA